MEDRPECAVMSPAVEAAKKSILANIPEALKKLQQFPPDFDFIQAIFMAVPGTSSHILSPVIIMSPL